MIKVASVNRLRGPEVCPAWRVTASERVGTPAAPIRPSRPADTSGMVRVSLHDHPLTASAALVWSAGLPRPLQQILFETADSLTAPAPPQPAGLISLSTA